MSQPVWIIEMLDRLDSDLREDYEERAAIMQYDGGLPRDHAECLALLDIIRRHPAALLPSYKKVNIPTSQGVKHE